MAKESVKLHTIADNSERPRKSVWGPLALTGLLLCGLFWTVTHVVGGCTDTLADVVRYCPPPANF